MRSWNKNSAGGFTLTELLVVLVLLGIIAGFAIPNYEASKERAIERQIATNLTLIKEALIAYKQRTGDYPPASDMENITEINETLGLMIIPDGVDYVADPDYDANEFDIIGSHPDNDWCLKIQGVAGASTSVGVEMTPHRGDSDDLNCSGGSGSVPTCKVGGFKCPWLNYPPD